jgi:hypothetical protein
MKKFCSVVLMVLLAVGLFATQYHSVPLSSEAYRIIEVGENRGIIDVQTEVKPYNLNTVRKLLKEIKASDLISESESGIIDTLLSEFDSTYGEERIEDYSSDDISVLNYTHLGVGLETTQKLGLVAGEDMIFDSRNSVSPYIMGDILNVVSYDLNFKINLDRIDANAYLPTELKFSTEGFYMNLLDRGARLESLPDGGFYLGIETFPEISTSIKDDIAVFRIGAVERDWGPGVNNIALSGTARVIDGAELSLKPAKWFSYSVMVGSLGQASLNSVNGIEWPSENMDEKTGKYSNNISIHRVELNLKGMKASIWESVIWRKRFELSYLNPLAIYMFSQNALGDYDNCLAGFDASYTVPGIGTFYAALAMDELNSIKHPLSCPRNILAFQAGATFSIPLGSFTELKVQGTYIPAFFGAHYQDTEALFANVPYTTAYVNKGQNIGYPVNPDTFEFLIEFDTTIFSDWKINAIIKDQLRSAQYSFKTTGTDVLTYMNYRAYNSDEYYDRAFLANIWNNILDMEINVEKKLKNITFMVGLQGMINSSRSFTPEVRTNKDGTYNPGKINEWGDWESTFSMIATVGAKIVF